MFGRPDRKKYGAKPFWAWNGKLDKDELVRQTEVMKEMGFGGYFMHSRTGLATEYLSDEWFDDINACADAAEKEDMEAWLRRGQMAERICGRHSHKRDQIQNAVYSLQYRDKRFL